MFIDRRIEAENHAATVGKDVSHLSAVFKVAEEAYAMALDYDQIETSYPPAKIVVFALFSSRKSDEITRIK